MAGLLSLNVPFHICVDYGISLSLTMLHCTGMVGMPASTFFERGC